MTTPDDPAPPGHRIASENTTRIFVPVNEIGGGTSANGAFINPVQEFNRDLSITAITMWSELVEEEKRANFEAKQRKKAGGKGKKATSDAAAPAAAPAQRSASEQQEPAPAGAAVEGFAKEGQDVADGAAATASAPAGQSAGHSEWFYSFTLLEALSATGLRAIRYAKEIPKVKWVLANDFSPAAAATIRQNVALNGLGPDESAGGDKLGKVRVNEGDAIGLMYSHRDEKRRFDVVDLDPYGTASPFIDGAVQAVSNGGLLCVTCTDLAVLAGSNYPEKCYSNYGGTSVKAEYSHEAALRLVLHSISTSAARYGRYIVPLLSLSIDFYVRVFVRVFDGANEVKKAMSKAGTVYVCGGCQRSEVQPIGRTTEKVNEKTGDVNYKFQTAPSIAPGAECDECSGRYHVGGPMWIGSLHDKAFCERILKHIDEKGEKYGTQARIKGMVTVASEELDAPFYFTPTRVAGHFHCTCPSFTQVSSALLNLKYSVSRSHAIAGSIKTDAPRSVVHDVFRAWTKKNPVNMRKVKDNSPAKALLEKEARHQEIDFTEHPRALEMAKSTKVKLVRYQQNPTPNWGPLPKAPRGPAPAEGAGAAKKRKREEGDEGEEVA